MPILQYKSLLLPAIAFSLTTIITLNKQFLNQLLSQGQPPPYPNVIATYVNKLEFWSPASKFASGIGVPGYAQPSSYNVVILSFWLTDAVYAAALAFSDPVSYIGSNSELGKTNSEIQKKVVDLYHSRNISVLISAFGASQEPTTEGHDPVQTCTNLAQFVLDNNFDGVDLDWEDSKALEAGTGEEWLKKCTKTLRQYLPKGQFILTHAPQAPYFIGTQLYKNGGYLKVNQDVGDLIDWYNVQYYNQEKTSYDSYEALFLTSNGFLSTTAVKEIVEKGIPLHKIVVGKPVSGTDVFNTGRVNPADFGVWARTAYDELGWNGGIFTWQYSSDLNGSFVETFLDELMQRKAERRRRIRRDGN